ncbi:hypothetical protein D9M73_91330 [compost metagenome]
MTLEPAAHIDQLGKTGGMAFGETVIAKTQDLAEDALCKFGAVVVFNHGIHQPAMKTLHPALAFPGGHGAAQIVGLARREVGRDHGDLHHLFLEYRYAQRASERRVKCRILRLDFTAQAFDLTGFQVRVHHAALDRPRPHDGDFHHQVVIVTRLEARQHGHLRAAFNLENTNRIGRTNHVVGGRVLQRNRVHLKRAAAPLVHQMQASANRRQHAQRQHIHLEQAHGVQVVLVPLDDAALVHGGRLHRHQPREFALRQHKTAYVLA